jgi:hypothetical protein
MKSYHRWYLEHISIKKLGQRSLLFPACRQFSEKNAIVNLTQGVKYRLYFYCNPNTNIDPTSFVRLKGHNGKFSQIFQLNQVKGRNFEKTQIHSVFYSKISRPISTLIQIQKKGSNKIPKNSRLAVLTFLEKIRDLQLEEGLIYLLIFKTFNISLKKIIKPT